WESLKDKKSTDAMAMMAALKQAIDKTNTAELQNFWAYFVSRHPRLKEQLSGSEQRTLDLELARLRLQNVLVLRHGEIEDYLPPGVSGVKGIVDLTTDRNWINRIPDESRRVELGQSICQILDVSKEQSKKLEEELRHQSVAFPQPVSERLDKRSRRIFQSIPHGGRAALTPVPGRLTKSASG